LAEKFEIEGSKRLASKGAGEIENDLHRRSLDFCCNVYWDEFEAAKEDHDFIRDWKP